MAVIKTPIVAGVLLEKGNEIILAGSCCKKCGHIFFPPRSFCTECYGSQLAAYELGKKGVLYSYTTSYMSSTHLTSPYLGGWIEMEGQIRLFAPISVEAGQSLQIGMKMELITTVLREEGEKQIIGYMFKPVVKEEV